MNKLPLIKYLFTNTYNNDTFIKNHVHNCYELVYYYYADGYSNYSETKVETAIAEYSNIDDMSKMELPSKLNFSNGSISIYEPNVIHNEFNFAEAKILAIGFQVDEGLNIKTQTFSNIDQHVFTLIERIIVEFEAKAVNYRLMIGSLLMIILILLQRLESIEIKDEDRAISFAKAYLDEYYQSRIDLYKVAKDTGYSIQHFRTLFKKITGTTPKQYILNLRLEYAKDQLKNPRIALKDIASKCGYDLYSQFSLFFKKNVGFSPNEYRKQVLR